MITKFVLLVLTALALQGVYFIDPDPYFLPIRTQGKKSPIQIRTKGPAYETLPICVGTDCENSCCFYLEEGVGESGRGQARCDGTVQLYSGDAVLGMVEGLVDRGEHQHVEERGDALSNDGAPELQCSEKWVTQIII